MNHDFILTQTRKKRHPLPQLSRSSQLGDRYI